MRHPPSMATYCAEASYPVLPVDGFYPSLADTTLAQLGPLKCAFDSCLRAMTLFRAFTYNDNL